jgi:glycerophosphoryl diester phosphodiesterase
MSVQLVVHRGYKNILYDNSMVGILLAVFKKNYTEFDILYHHGKWMVCHDFNALTVYTSSLEDLLAVLREYRHRLQKTIILDVKWDFVWNHADKLPGAIQELRSLMVGLEDAPFWVQASNPLVLGALQDHDMGSSWRLGMIVYSMDEFHTYKGQVHYVMVSLHGFPLDEIKQMSQERIVIGYTCHNITELSLYRKFFRYIKGVVCDVWV